MDFTYPDSQPDRKSNELIRQLVRGPIFQMPTPVNSRPSAGDDDDDE